jgi:hypothetical protein
LGKASCNTEKFTQRLNHAVEHMTVDEKKEIDKIQQDYLKLKAEIGTISNSKANIYNVKHTNITAPANRTAGTHYAYGPLISKSYIDRLVTSPPINETLSIPTLKKSTGFISPNQTWSYEIDGTIRTAYNKVSDKMGSCLTVQKNNNITLTENPASCAKWTWDAKGRLKKLQTDAGTPDAIPKCLTVTAIPGTDPGVILDSCPDNLLYPEQIWSFSTAPPRSKDD